MSRTIMMRKLLIAVLVGSTAVPCIVQAEVPGVAALVQQGRYWQGKGRQDLANQAFRRALVLDPSNGEARRGLNGGGSRTPARPPAAAKPAAAPTPARQARSAGQPTPRTRSDTGGDARAAGFRALERSDLAEASTLFERALSRNGADASALGGLGIVRLRQSRFSEARDLLERASRTGSAAQWAEALASARFYGDLADAQAALSAGRLAQAQAKAEGLVRSGYIDRQPALELLANIYERQGRYADAADMFRQASTQGASDSQSEARLKSRAARGRALAAVAQGDPVTAEREFQSGLLLDQSDPWIRYEYARFMIDRGRTSDADSLVRSLSASSSTDALYAAALINAELARPAAADELISRIPDVQRTTQMRNFALGLKTDQAIRRAREIGAMGRQAEARAALQQLSGTPGMTAAKQAAIADALYDLGDLDGAAGLAQQALAGDISDVEGYEPVVRVLAKTGRDDLAAAALQRANQMAGGSADGQRALARISGGMAAAQADRLRLAQQYAPAFDLLQSAWNAAPGNREVLSALARLYQSGGMPARAAQSYQMILAQSPKDRDATLGLIETAGAAGDTALSRQAIDQAAQQWPNDHEVYLAAARMEQARGNEGAAIRYLKRAREIYARQAGIAPTLTAANPFGTAAIGENPFRSQAVAPAPAPINPFALSGGARLPSPASYGSGYGGPAQTAVPQQSSFAAGTPGFASNALASAAFTSSSSFETPQGGSGIGDPVLARLESDIRSLSRDSGPRAEVETGYRERSGEPGLSELKELTGSAAISTSIGNGRLSAKAEAVVLDAGAPSQSGQARFGGNGLPEAAAIVGQVDEANIPVGTQHASGVALSASYKSPLLQLEAGTTPLGFGNTRATWHAAVTPQFSSVASGEIWFERQPVKDSIISYAGARNPASDAAVGAAMAQIANAARDPVTGLSPVDYATGGAYGLDERWGQVMKTGGGISFSYDRNGTGFYGDATYHQYRGENVRNNYGIQLNAGGYMRVYQGNGSTVTGGINVNYQDFANNQNFFTFGHGGYFSPQSFLSVAFPLRYTYDSSRWEVRGNFAPGYQSFDQDAANLYPTSDAAQGLLNDLKLQDSDVRSRYDGLSKTGFALSADGAIYYRVSPSTRVGGQMGMNTFGTYDEFHSLIGIRQSLGAGR
ncbi:cellulose synthase subunit BcsC-related outer membrane protein (plasmid) [Sphingobium sp. V4]|uniref:cellulose biosynthesis protein BcsC n=1 Tax=Sphingobium sp. V4 TaxID=3038927 RepID=UPI0025581288|nr:cellulose biosynthesis protein BcsC [Sphingobium sp. V4]WIW90448.1 cellulose synthase subunit BcsC-related outer membrane protein [Sphingobium sp. V4]